VSVTPAGRARLRQLERILDGIQEELLAPLAAGERAELTMLLARVLGYHAGRDTRGGESSALVWSGLWSCVRFRCGERLGEEQN
jgi:hypothetical protein